MDYDVYVSRSQEGGRLDEAGDHAGAAAVFQALAESDIADIDRSRMWQNVGVLLDKLGRKDEALKAYDRGSALELPLCRSDVTELKASLLHTLGRNAEALAVYRLLASRRWVSEWDKHRLNHNIAVLSGSAP